MQYEENNNCSKKQHNTLNKGLFINNEDDVNNEPGFDNGKYSHLDNGHFPNINAKLQKNLPENICVANPQSEH